MALIDFILNLAGVLLWLTWLSIGFDPLVNSTAATLAGTLRRAEPASVKAWHLLAGLAGLLILRALLYWQLGAAVDWTPTLRLGAIALAFRSDMLAHMLLFSGLSFVAVVAIFYVWLLFLSLVNGGT